MDASAAIAGDPASAKDVHSPKPIIQTCLDFGTFPANVTLAREFIAGGD